MLQNRYRFQSIANSDLSNDEKIDAMIVLKYRIARKLAYLEHYQTYGDAVYIFQLEELQENINLYIKELKSNTIECQIVSEH